MTDFGRYKNLEKVGHGGFATVYKATDPKLNRPVALKILNQNYGNDPAFAQRFQQEAETVAQFSHHHIVTIYEVDEIDRQVFIAMEFLAGGDLQAWLNEKGEPLTITQAIPFLQPMASALDYAHKRGIVHRDIKPSNMMLQQTGDGLRVVLTDFGLVKAIESSVAITMTNQMLGSPEYMAPEQADITRADEIGPHTDLYAFGIVAYQMLAGRVPFPGHSLSVLLAHINTPIPSPQEVNEKLPPDVAAILLKMLSKAPTDRYPTAIGFVNALQDTAQSATQSKQREAQVAPLYAKLQTAKKAADWLEVMTLTAQINMLIPDYKDVATLQAEAMQVLQVPADQVPVTSQVASTLEIADTPQSTPEPQQVESQQQQAPVRQVPVTSQVASPLNKPDTKVLSTSKARRNSAKQKKDTSSCMKWGSIILVVGLVIVCGGLYAYSIWWNREISVNNLNAKVTLSPPPEATLGDAWERSVDGMQMVYVPDGTFAMGSYDGDDDEKPVHNVTLDAFWIDRTEVTHEQYGLCIADGTCEKPEHYDTRFEGDQHPVANVHWNDAVTYCGWAGARLPTEAEWEYAAKGPDGNTYPWGDESPTCNLLNYWPDDSCIGKTTSVASYSPVGDSWVGASDMAGNVWEWVNDRYDYDYYTNSPTDNPTGRQNGSFYTLRGGGYYSDANDTRSFNRYSDFMSTLLGRATGFRCALPGK